MFGASGSVFGGGTGGGPTITASATTVPAGQTGQLLQFTTTLAGGGFTLAGGTGASITAAGAFSLSVALANGASRDFTIRAANATTGDALEKRFTISGVAAAAAPSYGAGQAPTISGTAQVGQSLTATPGTPPGWPTPTLTGQWLRDGSAITGANGLTYEQVTADLGASITYRETATNASGSATATSNALGPVAAASGGYAPRRDAWDVTLLGASTTAGGHGTTGLTPGGLLATVPGNKSVFSRALGGTGLTHLLTTQTGAMAVADRNALTLTQFETNSMGDPPLYGRGWLHAAIYKVQFVGGGKITADAVAGKRHLVWMGTEANIAYLIRYEQFRRAMWADYPGCASVLGDYWSQAPAADAAEEAVIRANGKPASYHIADLSHPNDAGYTYMHTSHRKAWIEALNGGVPFVVAHRYYATAATAQTNGGLVCQIHYVGDATGTTWAVLNRDGTTSADFALALTGSTLNLNRASATVIKEGYSELFLKVTRASDGGTQTYRIRVCISGQNSAPTRALYDGEFVAYLDTNHLGPNDVNGLPTFSDATTRRWDAAVGSPGEEMSLVLDLQALAADDALDMYLLHGNGGTVIRRLTTGGIRVSFRDDSGTTVATLNTGTALFHGAAGRRWLFASAKVGTGAYAHIITDNGSATAVHTGTATPTGTTITNNRLVAAEGGMMRFLTGTNDTYNSANTWRGWLGTFWMAPRAIDWTVAANRNLFRDASRNPVNLPTTGIITPVSGINAGVAITPTYYHRGHAGDMCDGRNYGIGGPISPIFRNHNREATNRLLGIPVNE